jgi:phosphatidylserine decarboxylase
VDVYLPVGSTPRVRVGEHTSAGTTVIAELR